MPSKKPSERECLTLWAPHRQHRGSIAPRQKLLNKKPAQIKTGTTKDGMTARKRGSMRVDAPT